MAKPEEEFEPLFDYSRVQPAGLIYVDDDDDGSDSLALLPAVQRKRISNPTSGKAKGSDAVVVVEDDDEEDWLPPPPPKSHGMGSVLPDDKTLQELRLKKQELALFARSVEDALREAVESAKREISGSVKASTETEEMVSTKLTQASKRPHERQKIILSIQGKDGQKQFRVYMDDKFERLFKMYADKAKLSLGSLTFCFDGDKVSPNATPESLGMEDDDIIEVHVK